MTDLYESLDVPPDADEKAIHRAYRKKSKKAHPDAGGSDEEFNAISHALDVLTDPERRARYDATGEHEQRKADNTDAEPLNLVGSMLAQLLARTTETTIDYVKIISEELNNRLQASAQVRRDVSGRIAALEKLRGRFSAQGQDVMSIMLDSQIEAERAPIRLADHHDEVLRKALEIVKRHKFRADPAAAPMRSAYMQSGVGNVFGGMRNV